MFNSLLFFLQNDLRGFYVTMMSPESGEPTVPTSTTAGPERSEASNEAIEAMDTKEDSTVARFAGRVTVIL